jgi:sarcosine oxidase subunit alpha
MIRRLPSQPGEWIDRGREIAFEFEGRLLTGAHGDTINSALCANGVRVIGRSFKYHRPRGVYSMAGHDAAGLFTDGERTNMRGDAVALVDGMCLRAVNTFGNVERDRMSITGRFAKLMPVGFYYKAFFRPRWMFPWFESLIRRIAGQGAINSAFPATKSPKDYAWCDVLVVGGGPSGLSAALAAADAGAGVLLVDENARLGGSLAWGATVRKDDEGLVDRVHAHDSIEVRCGTSVAGVYTDHWLALVDADRLTKLRAKAIVFATGAIEQPAVFQNNDLPGVMLASAAQRLVRLYSVKPFDRVVTLTANSDGYRAALDYHSAGIEVVCLVDLRPDGETSPLRDAVTAAGIEVHTGCAVVEAVPSADGKALVAVIVSPVDANSASTPAQRIVCDGLAVAVGWMPNLSLPCQAGVPFAYDRRVEQLVPGDTPPGIALAGRVNGVFDLDQRKDDGRRAGLHAAAAAGIGEHLVPELVRPTGPASSHPYPFFEHAGGKNFVDFDEDLHLADFRNAHSEGFDSIELMKRYSTVGMGPSQGKLANMNSVRIVTTLNGDAIDNTGMTTARPFYQPVPIGHLAGRRFHPMRHTPMHDWHTDHGATFVHAGSWYRAEYYHPHAESRAEAILVEARAVRESCGLIDISTLGKLRISGPDAVTLLERTYTGCFSKLAVGQQRYAVALDESGVVIEDGLVVRLADDAFYVTATSSGVDAFCRNMQRWAMIWDLDVIVVNATGHFAAMNIAGPSSREILSRLTDVDLSGDAFPYMRAVEGEVAGVGAMLLRVGFVGEVGFEVHVPASQGMHVWTSLIEAGASSGLLPFGLEAQRLLRLEKGHLIISQDTDALSNLMEAGLGWTIGRDKPFFIGRRSTDILRKRPLERKLVGLRWPDGYTGNVPKECHLVVDGDKIVGRITSIAERSTLGYPLGMAVVHPDYAKPGTEVTVRLDGDYVDGSVVALPHYDVGNTRQD